MADILQVLGALLILAAFAGVQLGRISADTWLYLWLNLVGSVVLAVVGWVGRDWGFLLLEGVWALVTAYSLVRKATGHQVAAAH